MHKLINNDIVTVKCMEAIKKDCHKVAGDVATFISIRVMNSIDIPKNEIINTTKSEIVLSHFDTVFESSSSV
jgi:hypothetical protein